MRRATPVPATAAVVGDILGSSGRIVSTTHPGVGQYSVQFDRNIDACTNIASANGGNYIANGQETTSDTALVTTWTSDSAGGLTPTDLSFFVAVHC